MKKKFFLCAVALSFLSTPQVTIANDLKIKISDLRNQKGTLLIAIYHDKKSFKTNDETNMHSFVSTVVNSTQKTITLHDYPKGIYAVTILHDENANNQLDVNSRGFPLEGFAYSNNVGAMEIPSFKSASFSHSTEKDSTLSIKMTYLK